MMVNSATIQSTSIRAIPACLREGVIGEFSVDAPHSARQEFDDFQAEFSGHGVEVGRIRVAIGDDPAHEVGLGQGGREEVLARGFEGQDDRGIVGVEPPARLLDEGGELLVAEGVPGEGPVVVREVEVGLQRDGFPKILQRLHQLPHMWPAYQL